MLRLTTNQSKGRAKNLGGRPPIMAYTGRGTFFRLLQVYEREGISLIEVYKRVGKFVFPSVNRPKRANRRIYGCEKKCVLCCSLFQILKHCIYSS